MPGGAEIDWTGAWRARLGLGPARPPTLAELRRILKAHHEALPFENLDPVTGTLPSLAPQALLDKLVRQRRGGYCFELNGLLALGLAASGFAPRLVMARVLWNRTAPGPLTHCLIAVPLDGATWYLDGGFGAPGPVAPFRAGVARTSVQDGVGFRLGADPGLGNLLSRKAVGGEWEPLYAFQDTGSTATEEELAAGNQLAATGPDSPFTRRIVVSRAAGRRRLVLDAGSLTVQEGGQPVEAREVATDADFAAALRGHFALALGAEFEARVLARVRDLRGALTAVRPPKPTG